MERNLSLPAMQCPSKRSFKGWFSKDLLFGRRLAIWKQYFQMMFKMMLSLKGILLCCLVLRRELFVEEKNLVESKTCHWKGSHIEICL